jgi:arylsulfatase A-like enzyme
MRAARAALIALAAAAVACAPRPELRHGSTDVLLVTVCTLRADHLGAWGYPQDTSPHLDQLAARSVVFEHALTAAPWTRPAIAALVTGRAPRALGIADAQTSLRLVLPASAATLPERLRQAGYATLGITANPNTNAVFGFGRGYDFYSDTRARFTDLDRRDKHSAEEIAAILLEQLQGPFRERRVFAHLVLVDVHRPYRTHVARERLGALRFDGESASYDLQIRYVDDVLRQLLADLAALGRTNLLVVVTSDHGEAFGERPGDRGHGQAVYNSTIWVPWLLHHPALAPRRITQPVRSVDLAPTLLDLLGLPWQGEGLDGVSLAEVARGRADPPALEAVVETRLSGGASSAILRDGWKLIVRPAGAAPELYHFPGDPAEARDLAAEQPERVVELAARLAAWQRERDARAPAQAVLAEPSPEEQEALRALGYLEPTP